ncbi:MAG: diacylglycerol kinase family protein [Firmicutes bacterium]|nr:diacylglycerol kinase family protein [Bacillota bacterium]
MSFLYALEGIIASVKSERNLRFHIAIANLIMVFAYFYEISAEKWAILILQISAVISAELINTAVERAVDTATDKILPSAKIAKDAAASAVLVFAAGAVAVGVCLFGSVDRIGETLLHIFTDIKILVPCLALGVLDIFFVVHGGKNVKKI